MNDLISNTAAVSMDSKEIAELVGSRHDSVKRAVETLANKGVIEFPQSVEIKTATKPVTIYRFTGEQGKRDSIVVVAQLSPEFTARLVDRWQELEQQVGYMPNFNNPAEAARAWATQYELAEQAKLQLEADKPYADIGKVITSEDSMTRRDWCALMKKEHDCNVKERALTKWLIGKGYCYRDALSGETRAKAQYDHLFKLTVENINNRQCLLLKVTGRGILELTPKIVADFKTTV